MRSEKNRKIRHISDIISTRNYIKNISVLQMYKIIFKEKKHENKISILNLEMKWHHLLNARLQMTKSNP